MGGNYLNVFEDSPHVILSDFIDRMDSLITFDTEIHLVILTVDRGTTLKRER